MLKELQFNVKTNDVKGGPELKRTAKYQWQSKLHTKK